MALFPLPFKAAIPNHAVPAPSLLGGLQQPDMDCLLQQQLLGELLFTFHAWPADQEDHTSLTTYSTFFVSTTIKPGTSRQERIHAQVVQTQLPCQSCNTVDIDKLHLTHPFVHQQITALLCISLEVAIRYAAICWLPIQLLGWRTECRYVYNIYPMYISAVAPYPHPSSK